MPAVYFRNSSTFYPKKNTLWEQHGIEVSEEKIQKWLAVLQARFEKDSGILTILTS